jgi:hypothetical protein
VPTIKLEEPDYLIVFARSRLFRNSIDAVMN